jgi:hypothetical protein
VFLDSYAFLTMKVFSTLAVCTTALVGAAYGAGVGKL